MSEQESKPLQTDSDAENENTSTVTMTTAQERLILDHSEAGIFKIQDDKIVYANTKAMNLCQFTFIDDLLYKSHTEFFSDKFCKTIEKHKNDSDQPIKPVKLKDKDTLKHQGRDVDTWIMSSHTQNRPCTQLVFIEKDSKEKTSTSKTTEKKNKIISEVSEALKQNRFKIFYQPVACLTSGNEAHYDVMLRMLTQDDTMTSAGEFMGEIDTHPIAAKIDKWVILQTIKNLLLNKNESKSAHLFIHLSGASVIDQNLPPWVFNVIKKSNIKPESLIFQIAEATVVKFKKESQRLFRNVKKLGCRTNICHFGLTDQPLSSLQEIDCDYVKLHNAFTRELADNHNSEQDVRYIVDKLHNLNLKTIVPHVETPKVMTQLWRCGVDYVQGFFLQKPKEVMDYDFSSDG